ncbi:MAG TPA: hypothetical protein VF017_09635 [Thermoanaerobaculia bacterium]|nr:hypothetical protein [Thermoanaerobaculia bacterium]
MRKATPASFLGALLLVLAGSPAAAQPWRGTASLELSVTEKGRPPAQPVEITLQFLDAEPKAGPPPLPPGPGGEASVGGLAEGKWLIEIKVGGKSAYSAVVALEGGKRATVVAGPVRDAAAPAITVKYGKSRAGAPPSPTPAAPEPRPEPARPSAPPPSSPPKPAPAPAPRTTPRETPTAPSPTPTSPTPSPSAPGHATPAPVAPPPASPAPTTRPSAPAPTPAPRPSFVTAPVRSPKDGTCPECKPGEYGVTAQRAAGPGRGETCDLVASFKAGLSALAASPPPDLARYVGPLADPVTGDWVAAAGPDAAARLPRSPAGAPCQVMAIVLPKGARYKGYSYEAGDASRNGACVGDQECEVGAARWAGHPEIQRLGDATVIFAVFHNQSGERERRAKLNVYFSHPDPGWKPPTP